MFQALLLHHPGLLYFFYYKTVPEQCFDLLHMWKNWCDPSLWAELVWQTKLIGSKLKERVDVLQVSTVLLLWI